MFVRTTYTNTHYLFYLADSDLYIELFCENKNTPGLECNGQCSLTKTTIDASEYKDELAKQLSAISFVDFIPNDNIELPQAPLSILCSISYDNHGPSYDFLYHTELKKPPELC